MSLFGNGSEKDKLKIKSKKLNLEKSIIFESWAKQEVLISYYKTANLFLSTSLFEGYGMTLIEAKTAGSPIVSTDIGIAKEIGAKIVEHEANSVAYGIIEKLL
jgi:glycosyltransferase involved in cell wall biosynthesis